MNWKQYVDNLVDGGFTKGALISENRKVWAASAGLTLSESEIGALIISFTIPNSLLQDSVTIEGTSYRIIKSDYRSIYCKHGNTYFCAVKTCQAIVIGFYPETLTLENASKVVEGVADSLIDQNY
eukprot:TRINITY_DN3610_c1_g1_i1.p1 TRINITY_DN3610_c1_g1~~TRINITY_DN3610_c1_g1_i1.p1  ORF type:complete len:125 (-),score=34.48 TRINITY_DN3610_c1_g1_i1:108-482(-)